MLDNPIEGATYDLQTGQIYPSKNGSLLKKKKEKREAERKDKSMALSKLDELSQVLTLCQFWSRNTNIPFLLVHEFWWLLGYT